MKKLKKIGLVFLLIGAILFASCSNNSNSSSNSGNADGSPSVDTGSSGSNNQTSPTNPENPSKDDPPEETPSYVRVPQKYKEPVTGKTAAEIIEMMGAGWNLGNTLDAARVDYSDNKYYQADAKLLGVSTEESWGMPKTTKAMIDVVAAAEFSHVRAPVSWHNHVDANGNIEAVWLSRVKEIVDWIIGDGMFCVINIHHDTWDGQSGFWGYSVDGTHESESIAFVEKVWDQVAKYFKDYDQRLVFETLNEPRVRYLTEGDTHEWGFVSSCTTCQNAATTINTLNKKALDKIRAGGGKNNERLVIVPPYVASPDAAFNSAFSVPSDSVSNLLAISVHAYQPYTFAMKPDGESEFTTYHKSELNTLFDRLENELGYPVFIGEFSATNRGNSAQRVKWAEYYVNGAGSRKMAYCLWDNNDFDKNTDLSERHGHLNRNANPLCWYDEAFIKAITGCSDLTGGSAGGSSGGGNENIPEGKTALGLTSFDGWKNYTVSGKSTTGVIIEHSAAVAQYACCGTDISIGSNTKVECKVKNNGNEKAFVKIAIKNKAWSAEEGDHKDKAGILSATINGVAVTSVDYGALAEIPVGDITTFVLILNTSLPTADQIVVSLNSEKDGTMPSTGSITISEAYMY